MSKLLVLLIEGAEGVGGDSVEGAGASGENALHRALLGTACQMEALLVPSPDSTALPPPSHQCRWQQLCAKGSQGVRLRAQHFVLTLPGPDLAMSCGVASVVVQRRSIGEPRVLE